MVAEPGVTIGPYEIVSLLGRGGMGEVWRARDRTLNREVALKVLPANVASDHERLARFDREAQLLASVSHPNIGAIYGVHHGDGAIALVLELVDGLTLAEVIARGPVALDEAIRIARDVAAALEAAHERGIIHRDLKPSNVKVTTDGHVKVLDFGLAKALDISHVRGGVSMLDTSPALGTASGVILGTPLYMSPEQAKGQAVDRRSDVWGFGCLLYELLTGARPFAGDSAAEVVTAILSKEADLTRVPGATPPSIVALLRRCFERDPKLRLRDIGEARVVLERPAGAWSMGSSPPPARQRFAPFWLAAGGVAVGLALAGLVFALWFVRQPRDEAARAMQFTVPLAPAARLPRTSAFQRPSDAAVAISRDGSVIVFAGERSTGTVSQSLLYRRATDQAAVTPVAGTEGASVAFLSPDANFVAFVGADGALRRVPVAGGTSSVICPLDLSAFGGRVAGGSWGEDGTIVLGSHSGPLWRVPVTGGTLATVTKISTEGIDYSHRLPHYLPEARGVLYTAVADPIGDLGRTYVLPREGGEPRRILENAADARYVSPGRIAFIRDGTVMLAPFDLERLAVTGQAEPALTDVMQSVRSDNPFWNSMAGQFDVSDTGTIVYAPGGVYPAVANRLVWVHRDRRAEPIGEAGQSLLGPRLSRDGRQIVVGEMRDAKQPLRLYDTVRNLWTSWVGVTGRVVFPVWTPDGHVVFGWFADSRFGMYIGAPDGSVAVRRLTSGPRPRVPSDVSADGRLLAFVEAFTPTKSDIWIMPLDGSASPTAFLRSPGEDLQPVFAPDGRWLAYSSDQSGRLEVYVQAFPGPGPRVQVSSGGGLGALWARDGRALYYVRDVGGGGTLMEVPIQTTPALKPGIPREIMPFPYVVSGPARSHDITADGQRFIVTTYSPPPGEPVTALQVIVNWR